MIEFRYSGFFLFEDISSVQLKAAKNTREIFIKKNWRKTFGKLFCTFKKVTKTATLALTFFDMIQKILQIKK